MYTLNCNGRLLVIDKPIVMGIINLTPDSFFSESRFKDLDSILAKVEQMLKEGATILDVGGQSSRPGSKRISEDEELNRVMAPLQSIHKHFPEAIISIDTFYSKVAKESVHAGASIVNDISAGRLDEKMIKTVSALKVPYILMHMLGTPQTMQEHPKYDDVTKEILDFLIKKIAELHNEGIADIIVDPGFGFGKSAKDNFKLLHNLKIFEMLQCPVLLGLSRKSFIYKTLATSAEESLIGTTVMNTLGILNGASILRVHDVKEAVQVITLVEEMKHTIEKETLL
jgi:dihydropteroate synthase